MEAAAAMDENNAEAEEEAISADGKVKLSTGEFTIPQLEAVFATIPLDITFVDAVTRRVTSATATPVLSLVLRAALAATYMTAIHQRARKLFVASSPSSGAVVATPPSSGLK